MTATLIIIGLAIVASVGAAIAMDRAGHQLRRDLDRADRWQR